MSDESLGPGPPSGGLSRRELLKRAAASGIALSAAGAFPADVLAGLRASAPKQGGTLRVGIIGGGQSEVLDVNLGFNEIDVLRNECIWEGLVEFDSHGVVNNQLAEEFVPNANASIWTAKLRKNVVFHNGQPMTADDVVYTFKYFLTPVNKSGNLALLSHNLSRSGVRKVDAHTVQFHLTSPHSLLDQVFAERSVKIFPNGSTAHQLGTHPIGTGPFMFKSWTRGEQSLFLRNPHWSARGVRGPTYVDQLQIISINTPISRFTALSSNQVDMVADIGAQLAPQVKANSNLTLLDGPSGSFTEFYMDTEAKPFNDPRVILAFKLLVDRHQNITNGLDGRGRLGNDLSSWFDPNYAQLPQHQHDPERARSLLKQAGYDNDLTIPLYTADAAPAMVEAATLLVGQAKQAGVKINLHKIPPDQLYVVYPRIPFGTDNWGGRPFVPMAQYAFLPTSPYNETKWNDKTFYKYFFNALKNTNSAKRRELLVEAQRILWEKGGLLIWGFPYNNDACSSKVKGMVGSPIRPLNNYDLSHAYFA